MASQPIYQFYAELYDYEPKMWRRFQTLNNVTMARLGYIVMTLFEMQASHLFNFEVPFDKNPELAKIRIELQNEYTFTEFEGSIMDAAKSKVKGVLNHETEMMNFYYDYGDGWEIKLTLEKIFEDKDLPGKELPRVLEGEGFGIIEDCGGPGGLEEIVKAYRKKKGSRYQEYSEWLGMEDLDLSTFDRDDMNLRLKKIPRIYSDIYEYSLEPTKQSMDLLMRKYKKI